MKLLTMFMVASAAVLSGAVKAVDYTPTNDTNTLLVHCDTLVSEIVGDKMEAGYYRELWVEGRDGYMAELYMDAINDMQLSLTYSIKSNQKLYEWLECDLAYELFHEPIEVEEVEPVQDCWSNGGYCNYD